MSASDPLDHHTLLFYHYFQGSPLSKDVLRTAHASSRISFPFPVTVTASPPLSPLQHIPSPPPTSPEVENVTIDLVKNVTIDLLAERDFHVSACESLDIRGRLRVSCEGLNGILDGSRANLRAYEARVNERGVEGRWLREGEGVPMKWGPFRTDLTVEEQRFDCLEVKVVKEVVSMYSDEVGGKSEKLAKGEGRKKRGKKKECRAVEVAAVANDETPPPPPTLPPSVPNLKLSPTEWQSFLSAPTPDIVLLDTRNVYESSIGRFDLPSHPTVLCNTRKFSDLPKAIDKLKDRMQGKRVFMYCTGGVRCEVASRAVIDAGVEGLKGVYMLDGGIHKYLEEFGMDERGKEGDKMAAKIDCLFKGKNFVFDPRRVAPVVGEGCVGKCVVCGTLHDDYDNGKAPNRLHEARCVRCRVLILLCGECRSERLCWGEGGADESGGKAGKKEVFCGAGGEACVDQGNDAGAFEVYLGGAREVKVDS